MATSRAALATGRRCAEVDGEGGTPASATSRGADRHPWSRNSAHQRLHDEQKGLFGFSSMEEAESHYLAARPPDDARSGGLAFSLDITFIVRRAITCAERRGDGSTRRLPGKRPGMPAEAKGARRS